KLETLIKRGSANSRGKDIFDIIKLFPRCINKSDLIRAIKTTFKNRKTEIPESFFNAVNQINQIVLRSSWDSILAANKPSFVEVWKFLLECLRELDAASGL